MTQENKVAADQQRGCGRWVSKNDGKKNHKTYPIRYKTGEEFQYAQCFYNEDSGWQGYDIVEGGAATDKKRYARRFVVCKNN